MYLDDSSLKYIFTKFLEHLCLRGMHHIAEVHVIFQVSFEGDFYGLGDGHGGLTGGEG